MRNEKILIVDDSKEIRNILSTFLKEEGFEVYTAENGKKALDLTKEKVIDLIITDLRMPEMDGTQLTKKMKEERPRIGIIIMTAYTSIYTEGDIRKIGADDYISKPFEFANLSEKIERVLFQMKTLKPMK